VDEPGCLAANPSAKDRFRAKLLPSERNLVLVQKAALWAAKVARAKPAMIFFADWSRGEVIRRLSSGARRCGPFRFSPKIGNPS